MMTEWITFYYGPKMLNYNLLISNILSALQYVLNVLSIYVNLKFPKINLLYHLSNHLQNQTKKERITCLLLCLCHQDIKSLQNSSLLKMFN